MRTTPFQATQLPASFRGVPFVVEENGGEIGRRGQLHEYWGRNVPYAEDGGRRGRSLDIRGYVIGLDCGLQRDALIAALEQPGPGLLIAGSIGPVMMQPHPQRPSRYRETWTENLKIGFDLVFVEPGQLLYPTAAADTQAASVSAGSQINSAADDDFDNGVAATDNSQSAPKAVVTVQSIDITPPLTKAGPADSSGLTDTDLAGASTHF